MISDQGHLKDTKKNKMLKHNMGYVQIIVNDKYTLRPLARLILEAFTPKETFTTRIDFINGDKNDIRLDNIKWHQNRTYEEALEYQKQYYEKSKRRLLEQPANDTSPRMPFKSPTAFYRKWNEQLYHQLEKDLPEWLKNAIRQLIQMNNEEINEIEKKDRQPDVRD